MTDESIPKPPSVQSGSEGPLRNEILAFLWETIKIVIVSLAIILPIRYYLIQPFFVKGASMESNFEDGDYIFVNELAYEIGTPHRGDVVVFRYPLDQSQFFIKRIIGLPGETVQIQNNTVTIFNADHPEGFTLDEPYLDPGQQTTGSLKVKLDDNNYFVLGDNRLHSSDSRVWGTVNKSLITGKAFVRLWPFSKAEVVPHATYSN